MDINVTIKAEGLEEAINNLAAALLEPKTGNEADAKESSKRRNRRSKNEKAKDAEEETALEEETTEEATGVTEKDEDMFDDEPVVTREEVQKKLKEIAGAGKSAGIKTLLTSYNVKKFSELPEDKLAEILGKAEAL